MASPGLCCSAWWVPTPIALGFAGPAIYVVPMEDDKLTAKFGRSYLPYRQRTGR